MKKMITFICLSAAVLTGCQDTTNNGNGNNDTTTAAVTTTAENTTAAEDITTEAVTTEAATAAADAETAPAATHEANVSAGGIQDMYPAIYQGFIRSEFERVAEEHNGLVSICYGFRDLDANGIPELIFQRGTCEADYAINVFTLDSEGEIKDLGFVGGGHTSFAYEKDTGDLVLSWGHMGAGSFAYMKMEDGVLKDSKEPYSFGFDSIDSYKELCDEKGIENIASVSVYQADPETGATSWLYHEDGTTDEIKGAYFDYCI